MVLNVGGFKINAADHAAVVNIGIFVHPSMSLSPRLSIPIWQTAIRFSLCNNNSVSIADGNFPKWLRAGRFQHANLKDSR
jgi:hypothetical protein